MIELNKRLVHDLTTRWLVVVLLRELEAHNRRWKLKPSDVVRFARTFADGKPWPEGPPGELVDFILDAVRQLRDAEAAKAKPPGLVLPEGFNWQQ